MGINWAGRAESVGQLKRKVFKTVFVNSFLHFLFSDLQIMIFFSVHVNENKEMMHVCRFSVLCCGCFLLHILKLFFPLKTKTVSLCSHSMNFDWLVIKRLRPLLAVSFTIVFGFNQKTETDVCIKQLQQIQNHRNQRSCMNRANHSVSFSVSNIFHLTYNYTGGTFKYLQDERKKL